MYPRISWELVTSPLGSTEHNLETAGLMDIHEVE